MTQPEAPAMADTHVVALAAPIAEVTILEDRALVTRRGTAPLPAGVSRLVVADVAPVIVDKTVTARVEGAARVHDVRVVRYAKALREDRPAEVRELEVALEKAREESDAVARRRGVLEDQVGGLDRLESLILGEAAQDAAWNRDARETARGHLAKLGEQAGALHTELAALTVEHERRQQAVRDLERRLAVVRTPATRTGARIEIDVEAGAAGPCAIRLDYLVPGACWRPWHTARLVPGPKPSVQFRSEGCVWQNTGEDWKGVTIQFSTQRPSLGIEPPGLESDVLSAQKKAPVVQVAAREQAIQTTGLGTSGGAVADEMPGIDDGGDILSLRSTDPADVPSDGRPYRVPYASFTAEADAARVLLPELAPCAFYKTVQSNAGPCPVLAGPVDLLRDGGFVGRTRAKYVAPGERFPIGWGPEPALRVRRETERDEEEAGILSGWRTSRHLVALRLSNIGAEALAVQVTERIPVSEIEQVEIHPDAKETTGGKTPDKEGFVTWDVRLSPYAQESLKFRYAMKKRKDVQGL
jgi:uncharacterized protein (TIGR02231 family)